MFLPSHRYTVSAQTCTYLHFFFSEMFPFQVSQRGHIVLTGYQTLWHASIFYPPSSVGLLLLLALLLQMIFAPHREDLMILNVCVYANALLCTIPGSGTVNPKVDLKRSNRSIREVTESYNWQPQSHRIALNTRDEMGIANLADIYCIHSESRICFVFFFTARIHWQHSVHSGRSRFPQQNAAPKKMLPYYNSLGTNKRRNESKLIVVGLSATKLGSKIFLVHSAGACSLISFV